MVNALDLETAWLMVSHANGYGVVAMWGEP